MKINDQNYPADSSLHRLRRFITRRLRRQSPKSGGADQPAASDTPAAEQRDDSGKKSGVTNTR